MKFLADTFLGQNMKPYSFTDYLIMGYLFIGGIILYIHGFHELGVALLLSFVFKIFVDALSANRDEQRTLDIKLQTSYKAVIESQEKIIKAQDEMIKSILRLKEVKENDLSEARLIYYKAIDAGYIPGTKEYETFIMNEIKTNAKGYTDAK